MAVGHFFGLDLRSHQFRQMAARESLSEHHMNVLKQLQSKGLSQQFPKGKQVLIAYSKAGTEFDVWKRSRH